jgi:hypothetical protein
MVDFFQVTFVRTSVLIPIQITNGFTNQEKAEMVLIYGKARGHSDLTRQIYGKRFPQRILPNARSFVNVVQHLRFFAISGVSK